MSESKHTPGPWSFKTAANGDCGIRAYDTGYFIECYADIRRPHENAREEAKANAYLVAAAPDLLEALRKAEQFITNGIELGYIRMPDPNSSDTALLTPGIVRAAISKATPSLHEGERG